MPLSPEAKAQRRRDYLVVAARTLEALKLAAGCTDCGYREHPAALHFDHREPTTKRAALGWVDDRSKLFNATRLRRFLEHVDTYCDIRCANCHAVRTMTEQHWRPHHHADTDHKSTPALF